MLRFGPDHKTESTAGRTGSFLGATLLYWPIGFVGLLLVVSQMACATYRARSGSSAPEYVGNPVSAQPANSPTENAQPAPPCLSRPPDPTNNGKEITIATIPQAAGIELRNAPQNVLVDPRGYVGITPCLIRLPAGDYHILLSKPDHSTLRIRRVVDDTKPELISAVLPELPWPMDLPLGEPIGWFTLATFGPMAGTFAYWGATERNGASWFLAAVALLPVVLYGQGLWRLYTLPPPRVVRHEYRSQ